MRISHSKKKMLSAAIALIVIFSLFLAVLGFASFQSITAQAKTNQNMWKNNGGITFDKNKIITSSDSDGYVNYGSMLPADASFNLVFKITSNNFDQLTLTTKSYASILSSDSSDITNTIVLKKSKDSDRKGKIDVLINDQKKAKPTELDINFYNTEFTLTFDKADNCFKLNGQSLGTLENYSFEIPVVKSLQITLQEIETDKKASLEVKRICGIDVTGDFEDTKKPVIYVDTQMVSDYIPVGRDFVLPVYYYDLEDHYIDNSNENNKDVIVKVLYNEVDDKSGAKEIDQKSIIDNVTTSNRKLAFKVVKTGYYWASVTVKDNADKTTTVELDKIQAVVKTGADNPVFDDASVKDIFANANPFPEKGEKLIFDRPTVTAKLNDTIPQDSNTIKIAIQYRTSGSDWSPSISSIKESDGVNSISFVPSADGTVVRFVAVDANGNYTIDTNEFNITRLIDTIIPEVEIKRFPEKAYVANTVSLPAATVSDKGNSSPSKKIEVYKGEFTLDNLDKEALVKMTSTNQFTPDAVGIYTVVYTVTDGIEGHKVELVEYLDVEPAANAPKDPNSQLSALEIVMISIAGVCAIAIVYLLIPTKKGKKKKA